MFSVQNFRPFFLLLSLGLLISCEETEEQKPLIQIDNQGFTFGEAYLSINDKKLVEPEVRFGNVVFLNVTHLAGFQQKDGRVFLGCSMLVTDSAGNALVKSDDIFKQYEAQGVTPEQASGFNIKIDIGRPMIPGQTYRWQAEFWDKSGPARLKTDVLLEVAGGNRVKIHADVTGGLSLRQAFISENQKMLDFNEVMYGGQLFFHLDSLYPLQINDSGKVNLDGLMEVLDEDRKKVFQIADLFSSFPDGLRVEDTRQLMLSLTLGQPMQPGKTYLWRLQVWDKNTQKSIAVESEISLAPVQ